MEKNFFATNTGTCKADTWRQQSTIDTDLQSNELGGSQRTQVISGRTNRATECDTRSNSITSIWRVSWAFDKALIRPSFDVLDGVVASYQEEDIAEWSLTMKSAQHRWQSWKTISLTRRCNWMRNFAFFFRKPQWLYALTNSLIAIKRLKILQQ